MNLHKLGLAGLLAMLALPATALAHPTVYTVTARLNGTNATYAGDPAGATLTSETRYMIAEHGFPLVLKESNGLDASAKRGVISYAERPGTWRSGMTDDQRLTDPLGQTGAQPHATCDVAALQTTAVISTWQDDDNPFFAYIPFQRGTAGIDDDPATWIPVVKSATGVDLSTLGTAAELEAACEVTLGGTFYPADTATGPVGAVAGQQVNGTVTGWGATVIAAALVPKDAEIATLSAERTKLTADKAELSGLNATLSEAKAKVDAALAALIARPVQVTAARSGSVVRTAVMATGPADARVVVRVTISRTQMRALGLRSMVVAAASGRLDAQGALLLDLRSGMKAAAAIAAADKPVVATITATSGAASASRTIRLTR